MGGAYPRSGGLPARSRRLVGAAYACDPAHIRTLVTTPLPPATDPSTGRDAVRVPPRRHRRRAVVLIALALFQFWLWGTRIVNLLQETGGFSTAFVAVHLALFTTAVGAGVVLAVLGSRMWVEARRATRDGDAVSSDREEQRG
jgi:hypothetical protein